MDDQRKLADLYKELDVLRERQIKEYKETIAVYKLIVERQEATIKMLMDAIDKVMGEGK